MIYGQFYFGNSFYVLAGYGKREVWSDIETEEKNESGDWVEEKCRITGEANIASIGIGNQWTNGFIVVGGRWAAYEWPVTEPKVEDNCTFRTTIRYKSVDEEKQRVKEDGFTGPIALIFPIPILFIGVQF